MEFFLLWWFLAGLVGVLAGARRRRPISWLALGIALTPITALLLLFSVPEGTLPARRPWGRVQVVALAAVIGLGSLLFYGRLASLFVAAPPP
jgi:peptidoglycan/LPS O-acetylase OafA/YrhL